MVPVSSTLYGSRFLTGEVGGSVTHQCFYSITPANKHDRKYWCKIAGNRVCYTIISTTGYTSKDYVGRVSLEDTPQNGTFTVMMTELKKSDAGTYRCGIGITNGDLYVTLNLTVLAGRMLAGERGGSALPAALLAGTVWGQMLEHPHTAGPNQLFINVKGNSLLPGWGLHAGQCLPFSLPTEAGPHVPEGAELFYVKLHSTLTMSCSFGPDYASVRKFLCKMEKDGCQNIIDSYGNIAKDYTGRVLMSSEETPGSFSIVITQMGWKDSGLYLCGVGFYGEDGETKELDVHLFFDLIFILWGERHMGNIPQAKPIITGVKGSSATFECHYNPLQRSSGRYWCKWRQNGCARIIDTSGYVSYAYEGRVAIFDSPENMTMTVILNQLSDKDNGYYWCMTDEQKEQQSSTELKIIDGTSLQKEVEAQVGSRVDLTCYYPCKYYSYQKYWCKWNNTGCSVLPASDQRQPGPGVTCDRDNKTVILSFDPVEKTNEGWYWCGVKRNGVYGETMAVQLSVTGGELQGRGGQGFSCSPGLQIIRPSAERESSLPIEPPSHAKEPPSRAEGGFIAQGRAYSDAGVGSAAASERLVPSKLSSMRVFISFLFTDLVSVGSYRTNISMSDFESVKGYSASNNACVKESQETEIGGEEFTTTTATPESAAETKKAKRSSKEDADLAYSTFLLTSSSIAQAGTEGASAAPDTSSPSWGGQI
uniref:Ig-like domain-containing protein n=1 Tax=Strix occidentalis caurina TaxID=311401 RepID=A0A8D0KUK5_STROC